MIAIPVLVGLHDGAFPLPSSVVRPRIMVVATVRRRPLRRRVRSPRSILISILGRVSRQLPVTLLTWVLRLGAKVMVGPLVVFVMLEIRRFVVSTIERAPPTPTSRPLSSGRH